MRKHEGDDELRGEVEGAKFARLLSTEFRGGRERERGIAKRYRQNVGEARPDLNLIEDTNRAVSFTNTRTFLSGLVPHEILIPNWSGRQRNFIL